MSIKNTILNSLKQEVEAKIATLKQTVSNLTEDAQNDAKGSAGDKHETALAMMHLEQEKLSKQINDQLELMGVLKKINPNQVHTKIALGSYVETSEFCFFVSASFPQINANGKTIISLSPISPLGKYLLGLQAGDSFVFNAKTHQINRVE